MIFYFSGTGNSLMAAKAVAREGEKIVNMAAARRAEAYDYDLAGDRIGFVFPVYCYTLPDVVFEFIGKINPTRFKYAFCIVTCGGSIGGTGAFFAKELAKKGIALDYVTPLLMPDNAIFYYDIKPKEEIDARLRAAQRKLDEIKEDLEREEKQAARGISSRWLRPMYHYLAGTKKFTVTEDCIHCGFCAKNCPDQAIRMEDGKPVWVKKRCTKCASCINRCPKEAIQYGKGTRRRLRYVNPLLKGE